MNGLNLAAEALTVQRDLHAALSSSISVQAALGHPVRIYDDPPSAPIYPYLTYGQTRSEDKSGDGAGQSSHQMTLHLWSRQDGRAEALSLLRTVSDTIRDGSPHTVVPLYLDILSASDGRTFHGLLRLSVIKLQDTPE